MSARDAFRKQFAGRTTLQPAELHAEFDLPEDISISQLCESLAVFEEEYGTPIGQLRAHDRLDLFLETPKTSNPFSWLFAQAATEDAATELNYRLKKQREALGLHRDTVGRLDTLRDYLLAWFGDK